MRNLLSWKHLGISYKLGCAIGLMGLLMIGLIFYFGHTLTATQAAFHHVRVTESALEIHAKNIEALMLQARRQEKNFFLRRDMAHLSKLQETIQSMVAEVEAMEEVAKRAQLTEARAMARELIRAAKVYEEGFVKIVRAWEIKGLDHKSGLQGAFRREVQSLARAMEVHERGELYIALLMMRRYEKEYQRTGSHEFKGKWAQAIDHCKAELEKGVHARKSHELMARGLETYGRLFLDYTKAPPRGQDSLYQAIREAAQQIEKGLNMVYIPHTKALVLEIRKHEKDYLLRLDKKYVEKTHGALEELVKTVESAGVLPHYAREIGAQTQRYKDAFNALVKENDNIQDIGDSIMATARGIEPQVNRLAALAIESAEKSIDGVESLSRKQSRWAGILGFVALGLGLALAMVITRRITGSLFKAIAMAQKIAHGDFTQKLDMDRGDEVGKLARSMDEMSDNLSGVLQRVTTGVQTLTSSSTELSVISDQMTSNSSQTADRTSDLAAASEQMATHMTQVAAATEQTSTNVQVVASAAEEMTATIREIAMTTAQSNETTVNAVKTAESVARKVNRLDESARDISKVTETISDISAQTNLLALNATIEAARAGAAGKGFAVVAGEIKDLADQTARATGEISHKISGIQTTTADSIQAIEHIVTIINTINENMGSIAAAMDEQAATTREISDNVNQTATGIHEVNDNVGQTRQVTDQVNQDVSQVSSATHEIQTGSHQVSTSALELSRLAEELNQMVGQFRI